MANFCISDQKVKPETRTGLKFLHNLHIYSVLTAEVILSSILIAVMLWLFVRVAEPEIHVTGLSVDALNFPENTPGKTLLHYNFTVHNPDLYKTIRYNVLVVNMFVRGDNISDNWVIINFDPERKGILQGPGQTTVLSNHSFNYAAPEVDWKTENLMTLKVDKTFIRLRFIMEVTFLAFNRVTGSRQTTHFANVFFNDSGHAFIDPRAGLKLKLIHR